METLLSHIPSGARENKGNWPYSGGVRAHFLIVDLAMEQLVGHNLQGACLGDLVLLDSFLPFGHL